MWCMAAPLVHGHRVSGVDPPGHRSSSPPALRWEARAPWFQRAATRWARRQGSAPFRSFCSVFCVSLGSLLRYGTCSPDFVDSPRLCWLHSFAWISFAPTVVAPLRSCRLRLFWESRNQQSVWKWTVFSALSVLSDESRPGHRHQSSLTSLLGGKMTFCF